MLGRLCTPEMAEKWVFPWQSPNIPFSCVGSPVRRDALEGEQEDTEVYALLNVTPHFARAARFGEGITLSPYGEREKPPSSSNKKSTERLHVTRTSRWARKVTQRWEGAIGNNRGAGCKRWTESEEGCKD
jgi:hypothetical protein